MSLESSRHRSTAPTMPSIADSPEHRQDLCARAKRKRDSFENDTQTHMKSASSPQGPHQSSLTLDIENQFPRFQSELLKHRVLLSKSHDPKRQRIVTSIPLETSVPARTNTPETISLIPCHLCHRKPARKSDLDSYADCDSCELRTCYVCMRVCMDHGDNHGDTQESNHSDRPGALVDTRQKLTTLKQCANNPSDDMKYQDERRIDGWDWRTGRQRMVCSGCCEERGVDGEVWCLGCLRTEKGG